MQSQGNLSDFAIKIQQSVMNLAKEAEQAETKSQVVLEAPDISSIGQQTASGHEKFSEKTMEVQPYQIGDDNIVLAADRLVEKSLPPLSIIEDPMTARQQAIGEENAVLAMERLINES